MNANRMEANAAGANAGKSAAASPSAAAAARAATVPPPAARRDAAVARAEPDPRTGMAIPDAEVDASSMVLPDLVSASSLLPDTPQTVGKPARAPAWDPEADCDAALVGELDPEDRKAILSKTPAEQRTIRYCLGLMTHSHSATERGNACVTLERILGREMRKYGHVLTDSWRRIRDDVGVLVSHLKEHHGAYQKVTRGPWDAVIETVEDGPLER